MQMRAPSRARGGMCVETVADSEGAGKTRQLLRDFQCFSFFFRLSDFLYKPASDYRLQPQMQENFACGQSPPSAALIGETPTCWVEYPKFKIAVRDSIIAYRLASDFDTKIRGSHGNLHYAALGPAWPFLPFTRLLAVPVIALSAHLRYLPISIMFACVTFSCTSAALAVGGVSSARALMWEARIGAVGGSLLSRLTFFFTPPLSFSARPGSYDGSPPLVGLPMMTIDINRNQCNSPGAYSKGKATVTTKRARCARRAGGMN